MGFLVPTQTSTNEYALFLCIDITNYKLQYLTNDSELALFRVLQIGAEERI